MKVVFPTLSNAISDINIRKLLRVLRCVIECAHTHYANYDLLNMFYVAVRPQVYGFIVPPDSYHPGTPPRPGVLRDYTSADNAAAQ